MDTERALVSKIISTGQLEDAISKGIRADLFEDDECREMFEYVTEHARRYKSPPSLAAVKEDKPEFDWQIVQDPLDYLVDKFNVLAKRRLANEMVLELAAACDDPKMGPNIDQHFMEASRKLATLVPSTEVHRFVGDMDKRIKSYEKREREGDKFGLTWGFPTLNAWTKGIRPKDFITVSGFSGLGKSTFLKVVAFNIWASGKTPLYISLEEDDEEIAAKWDAMAAELDFGKMRQLELPTEQMKKWHELRDRAKDGVADIPIIDSIRSCTPDNVFAETVRHKPDVVLVDYISLMRSGRPQARGGSMWQAITEITQDLKQNARTLGVPIVAAAQTNRSGNKDGAELENIGNSISIVQDSDIVIGLFADDEMKDAKEMQIRVNKNRRGRLGHFMSGWDHETTFFQELTREARLQRSFKRSAEQREEPLEGGSTMDALVNRARPQLGRVRPGA